MKHTLKSLLITTVLTLPSVFGSNAELTTSDDGGAVEAQIAAVSVSTPNRSSNFNRLPSDVLNILFGCVITNGQGRIEVGFATFKELVDLWKVNKQFANRIQPILKALRAFIVSRIKPVMPRPALSQSQREMVQYLGNDPTLDIGTQINAVSYFNAAKRLAAMRILPEVVDILENFAHREGTIVSDILDAVDILAHLGSEFKKKAVDILENFAHREGATVSDIIPAAFKIGKLGSAFHERAVTLLERGAHYSSATAEHIYAAAWAVAGLDEEYKERAAVLYELSAHHSMATVLNIREASLEVAALGSAFHERAAALRKLADEKEVQEAAAQHRN